jgi:hypothetical protein
MVSNLKKAPMILLLLVFSLLFFSLTSAYVNASAVNTKTTTSSSIAASSSIDVQVDQVNHTITIQEGGSVIINDTLKLSSKSEGLLQNFSFGFPYKINDKEIIDTLDYCLAYVASNPAEQFEVERDVGLGGRIGFYGVNVIFPQSGLNISNGGCDLIVVFVFSDLISTETSPLYNVTFPMYPSLTQNASVCDVTVTLPSEANFTDSIFNQTGLDFNITTVGDSQVLEHIKSDLNSFAYEPAWSTFEVSRSAEKAAFLVADINEVKREITLDQWGDIYVSNCFDITNRGYDVTNVKLGFPEGAYDLTTRDEMDTLGKLIENGTVTIYVARTGTRTALVKDESLKLFLNYRIPWEKYVTQSNDGLNYNLNFAFLERFNWTIRKLTVSITLPEGAEFQQSPTLNPNDTETNVFQETVTFTFFNATPFENLNFNLTYRYSVFWASFYPTLWMGILVIVASAIAFLWRAPKPPGIPIIPVPPEDLRKFVEAYEEKTSILFELESMEEQLRRGRIPRRRYKVRKKMLDGRLSTLSRDLSGLREKIRVAGPKYADIMRQVEVAETMLEGVETDIRRVEARYRRGEISKGAYGKLLEEYNRRMDRARTTIDGVLLRLREEIR